MQKYISFLRLTEKGLGVPPAKIHDVYTQMLGITESFGGRTLEVWTAGSDYDFVAFSEFPTEEAAFKARVKLSQLGFARLEGGPTFSIETFLSTASEERVPAVV